MKNKLIVFGVALLVGLMLSGNTFAADGSSTTQTVALKVDGSALLAVVGAGGDLVNNGVSISLQGAGQAGAEVMTSAENTDSRLRISSLVDNLKTRTITAQISPALTTSGTTLSMELIKPSTFQPQAANGGTSKGILDMTDGLEKTLVEGITTCWSGIGNTDGYTIHYIYAKKDGATALASKTVTVKFTISDQI